MPAVQLPAARKESMKIRFRTCDSNAFPGLSFAGTGMELHFHPSIDMDNLSGYISREV